MAERKLCVISGATSGIGWAVAHKLAKRGFDLKVIGRNDKKGEELQKSLAELYPECNFEFYVADLSSIQSIKKVAQQIAASCSEIDVLINNAGGVFSKFEKSVDGIEMTLANNHINYFVLTNALMPKIQAAKAGKIIIVASESHFRGKLDFESFTAPKKYNILKAYRQSKLANVLFAYKLKRLLEDTPVSTFVLHPGTVKTPIGAKSKSWLHRFAWSIIGRLSYNIKIEDVAKNIAYLACEKETHAHNGFYFDRGLITKSAPLSYDEALQDKLWTWSEEVVSVEEV